MPIKDSTKILFAKAIEDMINTMPLSKIRIKDLCDRCGTERQTFYYHFKDKFDLIAWIFEKDLEEALEMANLQYGVEMMTYALIKMKEKNSFYKKVFNDCSQNSLIRYIHKSNISINERMLKKHLGITKLSEEMIYAIKYYSYGCLNYTIEWITENSSLTAEELAKMQYKYMPSILRDAYLSK